jgi:hypothetical protein
MTILVYLLCILPNVLFLIGNPHRWWNAMSAGFVFGLLSIHLIERFDDWRDSR